MAISQADKDVLRRLVSELAQIAAQGVHKDKAAMWKRVNALQPERPVVLIFQIPWHEMNVDDELTCRCSDPWARRLETEFRMQLYQWRHMPGDMIVNDWLWSPLAIRDTGFGISVDSETRRTDPASSVLSYQWHQQIKEPQDAEKIKMPVVTFDRAATEQEYQRRVDIFGDIMPVRKRGTPIFWFAPWDFLIMLWGVEQAMIDMVMRPDMVNAVMTRLVDAWLCRLAQFEEQNLLSLTHGTDGAGSGGYTFTGELPGADYDPAHVRPHNMWGGGAAQIFSDISPEMHWEFALKHEIRWYERFGLNYYGCCEPLDGKVDILRHVPDLRKISMSPWIKPERAVRNVGTQYVFSHKPSPAILAEDRWRPQQARKQLAEVLEAARGLHVEVILKDISTVRYEPRRLWEWEKIAMEVVQDCAP